MKVGDWNMTSDILILDRRLQNLVLSVMNALKSSSPYAYISLITIVLLAM